ncbi:MAG: transposase [Oligoflexales bacterium]|nr:transposase [Oligoflexales bacterium]
MTATETEKMGALKFLGRQVQQILPKGFKRIRYFGLQASKDADRLKYLVLPVLISDKNGKKRKFQKLDIFLFFVSYLFF